MDAKKKTIVAISSMLASALLAGYGFHSLKNDEKRVLSPKEIIQEKVKNADEQKEEFKLLEEELLRSGINLFYFICRGKGIYLPHGMQTLGKEAKMLAEIKDGNGNDFFSCEDLAKYLRYGGTIEYALELSSLKDSEGNNLFYGAQLPQLAALKLSLEELIDFKDTGKQNALLVYPVFDINSYGFEGAFRTPAALDFFDSLKKTYDLKVIVASRWDEICYPILNLDQPAFDFLMISGHGTKTSLRLGKKCDDSEEKCNNDEYELNSSNNKLRCLRVLKKHAVIFLNSCSTGEGRDNDNLASRVSFFSGGKTVVSSEIDFSQDEIKYNSVGSINPLEIRINLNKIDYTYIAKINPQLSFEMTTSY